jgi:nicotinate phosphoribosyltransferase
MKHLAMLTDFYELTMMHGYYFAHPDEDAVFDMFFRRQPFDGGFTVFAGLDPLVDAIVDLRFTTEDIDYLDSLGSFKQEFLQYLRDFRFKGDVFAIEEGSIVFPNEPLVRVHGKLLQAQLVESMVLNFINYQSLIATKTARIVIAANGGSLLEFGLRRAHGIDGAVSATRAAYIGGASATSNVLAGKKYGIPVSGTMAHSWVMSFDSELEAFEKYAEIYPDNCVLLVDTFDTIKSGVPNAIKIFKKLKKKGHGNFGIRLDSGDLEYLSKEARRMFDYAGLTEAKIYASNELDEWIINQIMKNGARIDAWGVGTKLVTADKDPALTGVYKIVAKGLSGRFEPCIKISNNPEKITNPGIKGICRFYDDDEIMLADLIHLSEEESKLMENIEKHRTLKFNHPSIDYAHFNCVNYGSVKRLLMPVIAGGQRVSEPHSLCDIQRHVQQEIASLHPTFKRLINPHVYKVSISNSLKTLKKSLIDKFCQE